MIMSEMLTKRITGTLGAYTVSVCTDEFHSSSSAQIAARSKLDRKYNIRIRSDDLVLLDALADQSNVPRSVLLNTLLHEILLDELMSIQEDDVRLLLAQTADSRASYDDLSHPWVFDAIQIESSQIVKNIERFNMAALDVQDDPNAPADHNWNSEAYLAIKENLKGMKK
jgi:hypothetical protein